MSAINSHVILSYIDTPPRILIWPANQVLVFSCPFALGMITDNITVGLIASFIAAFLFKIYSRIDSIIYCCISVQDFQKQDR